MNYKIMDKPFLTIILGFLGLTIGLAEIHILFKILALAVPTFYTAWRWYNDIKNVNKGEN